MAAWEAMPWAISLAGACFQNVRNDIILGEVG
jgi:hypothetical protein